MLLRLLTVAPAVAAVIASTLVAVPANAGLAPLAVTGNRLTAGGAPIALHGVNRSGTEYACIQGWGIFDGPADDASVRAIAGWHANIVRVLLNEDCWLGINGVPAQYGGVAYQQAIVTYVNLLHAEGLYAEISLIWAAPGTYQATYQPNAPDLDHSPAAWAGIAQTFKADRSVILAPWGETTVSWACFRDGCANEATYGPGNATYQTAGMQQAVNIMRQAGYTGPIAIPCIDYANDCADATGSWLGFHPADPLKALVAEAHIYGNNSCGAQTGGRCLASTISPITGTAPVILGETGETYDDSECSAANIQVILQWADANAVGWEAWTWDTWQSCSSLVSDYSGTANSSAPAGAAYASFVRRHLAGYANHALPLGGRIVGAPSATSWGSGRLDLFVRGADDQLWHVWNAGAGWEIWEPLGGQLSSSPSAVAWSSGRIDVFVRGADDQLWHRWFASGAGWSSWEALGGVLASARPRRLGRLVASTSSLRASTVRSGTNGGTAARGARGNPLEVWCRAIRVPFPGG